MEWDRDVEVDWYADIVAQGKGLLGKNLQMVWLQEKDLQHAIRCGSKGWTSVVVSHAGHMQ